MPYWSHKWLKRLYLNSESEILLLGFRNILMSLAIRDRKFSEFWTKKATTYILTKGSSYAPNINNLTGMQVASNTTVTVIKSSSNLSEIWPRICVLLKANSSFNKYLASRYLVSCNVLQNWAKYFHFSSWLMQECLIVVEQLCNITM